VLISRVFLSVYSYFYGLILIKKPSERTYEYMMTRDFVNGGIWQAYSTQYRVTRLVIRRYFPSAVSTLHASLYTRSHGQTDFQHQSYTSANHTGIRSRPHHCTCVRRSPAAWRSPRQRQTARRSPSDLINA